MNAERCLLIAEDDPNDVFLLRRAFDAAGARNPLVFVADGQETIEYLSGKGKFEDRIRFPFPAALILDLKMPRKTGMDVLRWKQEQPGLCCIPVIVFSSSAHPSDVERAYRLGANAFVVKPASTVERTEFARAIKEFWLAFNEPPMILTEGLEAARRAHAEEA